MRRLIGLSCLIALLGCGGDKEEPADRLQGNWISETSDEFECGSVLTFEGDKFEMKDTCVLESGEIGVALHGGTFKATDSSLTFDWLYSSCEDPDLPGSSKYDFLGDRLRMIGRGGAQIYDELKSDGGGGGSSTILFGCYDEDGLFEQRDVEKL